MAEQNTNYQPELAAPAPGQIRLADTVHDLYRRIQPSKIGLFLLSMFLFVLAIILMKEGARDLTSLVRNRFEVSNAANSLGFGWLFAYIIMSGSPVAAAALTFYDAGAIDELSAFAMIIGSRLGASFIVLFVGFIYVLRGRDWSGGLSMGLLSLTVTGTTYLVAFFIGVGLLQTSDFSSIQLSSDTLLTSVIDLIFYPIADLLLRLLPRWMLFLVGLGLIMLSFHLFDRCLPQMVIKESQLGHVSRLVYRPWMMFVLGAAVTVISMSVSISLSILVPLSHRGFIRRENVIPYIMGANITTFIDTLLAALFVDHPAALTIVFVGMLSITIVSLVVLSISYRRYERAMLAFVAWVTSETRNLAAFMLLIFAVPIILMLW